PDVTWPLADKITGPGNVCFRGNESETRKEASREAPGQVKSKRQTTKVKPKRSVAKKSASRRPMTPTEPSALQTETTIVDVDRGVGSGRYGRDGV
ncbi:MAG: hypothetical protein ACXWNN_03545, partial [Candidatus Binataceae bacterium]